MADQPTSTSSTAPIPENAAANAKRLARRKFLTGTAMALPAVMTLTPGSAMAMTSITCGQKALDSGATATCLLKPPSNCNDGKFRLPVKLHDKLVWDSTAKRMKPNGVATYFEGMKDGNSVWRKCSTGAVASTSMPTDCNPNPQLATPTGYAIVHITADAGKIKHVGSPTNPSNCIITSAAGACMASLAYRSG